MKLQEIFTQLSYGELSQICVGGAAAGVIDDSNYQQVTAHVNLGLTALYKRFPLKEGRLVIGLLPEHINYTLTSAYALNNMKSKVTERYIQDTVTERFTDDILKVERVYTDRGKEFGLNDDNDPYAFMTPSSITLRAPKALAFGWSDLPTHLRTNTIEVVYRANHPIYNPDVGSFDPERIEIELPYTHLEPLLYFVASRFNNPVGMANEFHAGNSYYAKYEASCQALEAVNLRVDQVSQENRLQRMGWV